MPWYAVGSSVLLTLPVLPDLVCQIAGSSAWMRRVAGILTDKVGEGGGSGRVRPGSWR